MCFSLIYISLYTKLNLFFLISYFHVGFDHSIILTKLSFFLCYIVMDPSPFTYFDVSLYLLVNTADGVYSFALTSILLFGPVTQLTLIQKNLFPALPNIKRSIPCPMWLYIKHIYLITSINSLLLNTIC
jgi:hypothetical protein